MKTPVVPKVSLLQIENEASHFLQGGTVQATNPDVPTPESKIPLVGLDQDPYSLYDFYENKPETSGIETLIRVCEALYYHQNTRSRPEMLDVLYHQVKRFAPESPEIQQFLQEVEGASLDRGSHHVLSLYVPKVNLVKLRRDDQFIISLKLCFQQTVGIAPHRVSVDHIAEKGEGAVISMRFFERLPSDPASQICTMELVRKLGHQMDTPKSSLRKHLIMGHLFRQNSVVFIEKVPKHSTRQQYYVLPEYERPAKYVQTRDPPLPPPVPPKIPISAYCQTLGTPVESHFCQTQPPPAPIQPKRQAVPSAQGSLKHRAVPSAQGSLRHRAASRIQAIFRGNHARETLKAQPKTSPLKSPPLKCPPVKVASPPPKSPPVKVLTIKSKSPPVKSKSPPAKSPPVKILTIKTKSPPGKSPPLKSPPLKSSPLKSILKRSPVPKPSPPS